MYILEVTLYFSTLLMRYQMQAFFSKIVFMFYSITYGYGGRRKEEIIFMLLDPYLPNRIEDKIYAER